MQDLATVESGTPFDVAPAASIVRSEDYGHTWTATASPMFEDGVFTTVMFLDRKPVLTDTRRLYRGHGPVGFAAPDGGKGHTPAQDAAYTTISELEVYYRG